MSRYFSKQNRALLSELIRTDFKLRYQGSVLGYLWSLLRPLLMFMILYVVFVNFLKLGGDIPHYPVYLLLGIVLWQFFGDMTTQSLGSVVGRGDLIRKIRIPRWIIVFSSSILAVINLLLNLVVIAVFMLVNGVHLSFSALWLPLLLVELYVFGLGVSLFLAAAFVKYRDVGYIWEVVLQAGFYMTPILYPLTLITNVTFQKLILLNPIAQTIQDARYAVVTHDTLTTLKIFEGGWYSLIPFAVILAVFVGGVSYFKSQAETFAENI